MASGFSHRFNSCDNKPVDKLLLQYDGKSLLQHSVDLLSVLLEQYNEFEAILVTTEDRLNNICVPDGVKLVVNDNPGSGQSESVKLGVRAATGDAYLFMTADQPKLTAWDVRFLLSVAMENTDKIIYPVVNGEPSTPVCFPYCFRDELLVLSGDTGGREIRNKYPDLCVGVEVENSGNYFDIDTPDDYNTLLEGNIG